MGGWAISRERQKLALPETTHSGCGRAFLAGVLVGDRQISTSLPGFPRVPHLGISVIPGTPPRWLPGRLLASTLLNPAVLLSNRRKATVRREAHFVDYPCVLGVCTFAPI